MYVQEHVRDDYVYKLEKMKHKLTYKQKLKNKRDLIKFFAFEFGTVVIKNLFTTY